MVSSKGEGRLLEIIQSQDVGLLENWLCGQASVKQSLGNLPEERQSQLDSICCAIQTQVCELTSSQDFQDEENATVQEAAQWLEVVAKLCLFLVDALEGDTEIEIPKNLSQAVVTLHDNCLMMAARFVELMTCVRELCTKWYVQELPQFESVGLQTLMVTISIALEIFQDEQFALDAFYLREVLKSVDFDDDSSQDLQKMLCNTFRCPSFLKTPQGRDFLSYILDLTPKLTGIINKLLRTYMPYWREDQARIYGAIFLQGWRNAQDIKCQRGLEEEIFKSYMELAVLAKHKKLAATLRYFLAPLHDKNRDGVQLDIAALMFKYYDPIVFRFLKAPNPDVQLNTLDLMPDIFPLLDYNLDEAGRQGLITKQICYLKDLMTYEVVSVRVRAIQVTFEIICHWWPLLPKDELAAILNCATKELVFDGASVGVRIATINGLADLMRCEPTARLAIFKAAKNFKSVLYDRSNIVQAAMIDFLRALQDTRNYNFQDVAPIESLLELLAANIPQVSSKIQKLMFREFFDWDDSEQEKVCQQLASFLHEHPGAGLAFCQHLGGSVGQAGVSSPNWECVLKVLGSLMDHLGNNNVFKTESLSSWQLLLQGVQQLSKGLLRSPNDEMLQQLDELLGMRSLLDLLKQDNSAKTRALIFSIATDMQKLLVSIKVRHYVLCWISTKVSCPVNCEEEERELECAIGCVAQPVSFYHLLKLTQIAFQTVNQNNQDEANSRRLQDSQFEILLDVQKCSICGSGYASKDLLLCDGCGKGFHLDCFDPPLTELPRGDWYADCCDVQEANVTMSLQVATRIIIMLLSLDESRQLLLKFEKENDGYFFKELQRLLEQNSSANDPYFYLYAGSFMSLVLVGQLFKDNVDEQLQDDSANLIPETDQNQRNLHSDKILEAIRIVQLAWDRTSELDDNDENKLRFVEMTCAVLVDGLRLPLSSFAGNKEQEVTKSLLQKFRKFLQLEEETQTGVDTQVEAVQVVAENFYEVGREAHKQLYP